MSSGVLCVEATGRLVPLTRDVTTVGRDPAADLVLDEASVSRLHAELIRRGGHIYVADLGLSRNGTRVNGTPVGQRLLADGDVISFGLARVRYRAPAAERLLAGAADGSTRAGEAWVGTEQLNRVVAPDLTGREVQVLTALCRPVLTRQAFTAPATVALIADELMVTEAAVKQHLLRLYQKFRIPPGADRRGRLANEVLSAGVIRPRP